MLNTKYKTAGDTSNSDWGTFQALPGTGHCVDMYEKALKGYFLI